MPKIALGILTFRRTQTGHRTIIELNVTILTG